MVKKKDRQFDLNLIGHIRAILRDQDYLGHRILVDSIDRRPFWHLGSNRERPGQYHILVHGKHAQLRIARQNIYQIALEHKIFDDADFVRIDLARGVATGKGNEAEADRCKLSRLDKPIKEGSNALRRQETGCHPFAANQGRLLVEGLAQIILHMLRQIPSP